MSGNRSKKEEKFTLMLQEKLNKELRKYGVIVRKHENLRYKVIVRENELKMSEKPKRGRDYAFQTDLLIENLSIMEDEKVRIIKSDRESINECKELIKNCKELINECEGLIKEYKESVEKFKELIKKKNKLFKIIKKYNRLIEKIENLIKNCKELINECEGLFDKNEKVKELIEKCEKLNVLYEDLINLCEELVDKYGDIIKKSRKKFFLFPLVVIEIKHGDFDTHDVLVYSEKALKHKQIYPYLRYGLVVVREKNKNKEITVTKKNKEIAITRKFFIHNKGFDFAYILNDINDDKLIIELVEMLKEQINSARSLLDIFINEKKVKKFNTVVKTKFDEN